MEIRVSVTFSAILNLRGIKNRSEVKLKDGTTIDDFLSSAGIEENHRKLIVAMVNGEKKKNSYVLRDGDSLHLVLPVGGG